MKNAFMRFGLTCVFGGVLGATALFAAQVNRVTVTLPHAVTVGSTTLPTGEYTISSFEMSDGDGYFIIRGDHTPTVTIQAQKIDVDAEGAKQTEVVFSQDGSGWHFEKMFLKDDSTGYQFVNIK